MGYAFQALFFRIGDRERIRQKIKKEYDEIEVTVHPGADYVCVDQRKPTYRRLPEAGGRKLSESFGDVILVEVSTHGNFHYEHWAEGALVRALIWAEGAAWEAEGNPEAWEQGVFPSGSPASGSEEPFIDPEAVYQVIREFHKLPPTGP